MGADVVMINTYIPRELRDRAKRVAKRHRLTVAHMVRESLERKLDELDAKRQQEVDKSKSPSRRNIKSISSTIPFDERETPINTPVTQEDHDRLSALFEHHAILIAEVIKTPALVEQRYREARAAIKQAAAIQYGGERGDKKLLDRLEACISKIARVQPSVQPQEEVPLSVKMSSLAEILIQQLRQPPPEPVVSKISPKRTRERAAVIDEE